MKRVEVVDYSPEWPGAFVRARDELEAAFLPDAVQVHHVGSTSVPGLAAKPVLDILIEASDMAVVDAATPRLIELGYEARGEYGIDGRRYFSRPPSVDPKTHVHAYAVNNPQILRHLMLRDYLRAHPEDAGRYGALKKELAEALSEDRGAYQAAKAEFVEELHRKAFAWQGAARR